MEEELKRITSKIMDEAKAKNDEIISQGNRDADSIIDEAKARSRAATNRIINEAQRDSEQVHKRLIADATIQARKKKLDSREEIISNAFNKGEKKLKEVSKSNKYPSIIDKLLLEACEEIKSDNIEVIVRKDDGKSVQTRFSTIEKSLKAKGINSKLSLSKETTNELGIIARSTDGKVEVSNTFSSRLERIKPTLRLKVAKILFK